MAPATFSRGKVLAALLVASGLLLAHAGCEADGTCAPVPQDPAANDQLEDSQSLLQAYVRNRRDLQPEVEVQDVAYGPECAMTPGTIVTLVGGRSGKFCSDAGLRIVCNKDEAGDLEKFEVVDAGDGRVGLKGGRNRQMCADTGTAMECNRPWIKKWEWFFVDPQAGGKVTLQGARALTFCSDELTGVRCTKSAVGDAEKFGLGCVGRVREDGYALNYFLGDGDGVVVQSTGTAETTAMKISFCTSESCNEQPLVVNIRFGDSAVIRNALLGGGLGVVEFNRLAAGTLRPDRLTTVRFVWTPAGWQIVVNGVRLPDFRHRTANFVNYIRVEITGGEGKTTFSVFRRPETTRATTTTARPVATTTTRPVATTARPVTATTTRAATTTTATTATTATTTTRATTTPRPTTTRTTTTTAPTWPPLARLVTCTLALDDAVTGVAYDGADLTSSVQGNKADWQTLKTFHINYVPGAYLTVAGRNFQTDGCNQAAGVKLTCDGLAFGGKLEAVNGAAAFVPGDIRLFGQGGGWAGNLPVTKFRDTWLPSFADPPVWPGTCLPYAAFRTRTEAIAPPTEPQLGGVRGSCHWFSHNHFTTFDGWKQDEYRSGKFWVVRHAYVQIQALFCGSYDPISRVCDGNLPGKTQAIAVGGPFLGGSTLIVETSGSGGRVYWDKRAVDRLGGADFDFTSSDGVVTVKLSQRAGLLTADLPLGIKLRVSRNWKVKSFFFENAIITMRPLRGQDGMCGDFDGRRGDDQLKGWDYQVDPRNDLFVYGSVEGPQSRAVVRNPGGFNPATPLCSEDDQLAAKELCGWKMLPGSAKATADACAFDVCAFGDNFAADIDVEHERLVRAMAWREINPPEFNRDYSGVWADQQPGIGFARSMLDSPQGWSAGKNVPGEWITLDLDSEFEIEGVVLQGRADADQWVTLYSVQYSLDGVVFDSVPSGPFQGARDRNTRVRALFPQPVRARFIRIVVQEWFGHISLRVGLLGCQGGLQKCLDYQRPSTEGDREYSTTWSNAAPGAIYVQSLLDSPTGWVATQNVVGQWMQIDLGVAHDVDGVVVQGRADADQRVTRFTVDYSLDGLNFQSVPGSYSRRFVSRHTKSRSLFPQPVRARFVRIIVQEWFGHIAMRAGVLACNPEPQKCTEQLKSPPEPVRDYSSTWNNAVPGTGWAQSRLDNAWAWVAARNVVGEWMQLDLDVAHDVHGVVVQGRPDADQRVTRFSVQYSLDGASFSPVPGTFERRTSSRHTKVQALFPETVRARFVRLMVLEWEGHISMRVGVLACNPERPRCSKQERNPEELSREYSGVFGNHALGTGFAQSALDSPLSWSAAANQPGEWMQMDLDAVYDVDGVVVQGRGDAAEQRVTKFTVRHSIDGVTWTSVNGVFERPFPNRFARYRAYFPQAVRARFVRIVVLEWVGHISLRAGVLACNCQKDKCPDYERTLPEGSREYSSVWGNQVPGQTWATASLDSKTGWVAAKAAAGEWMQFDLDTVHDVEGVVVQGRFDADQRVTKYLVQYSIDGVVFETIPWVFERPHANRNTKVRSVFPQPVRARFVRLVVQDWVGHVAMRASVLACNPQPFKCPNYQRNPDETIRDYSSVGVGNVRSMLDSPDGWVAARNVAGEWMQIDVESVSDVDGVVVQGRASAEHRVTKFTVQYSLDGNTFQNVPGTYFRLAFSQHTKVRALFPQPVRARFVRIVALDWVGAIGMRAGVLACNSEPEKCANSLRNPAEIRRDYSSIFGNADVGTGLARSRLDSPASWSAAKNEPGQWMQLDLALVYDVHGVVVQGRADADQRVTKFTVQYGVDSGLLQPVPGVFERNLANRNSKMSVLFPQPVRARFLRITVLEWVGHISMRLGALGCNGVYIPPKRCRLVTCAAAMDDELASVAYGNLDITSLVQGNRADRNSLKFFHINYNEGAYLAVSGRNKETDGCNQAAGFKMQCPGLDTSGPRLEAVSGAFAWPSNDPVLLGQGAGWQGNLPVTRWAGAWLPAFGDAPVWPGSCQQNAVFRVRTDGLSAQALQLNTIPQGNAGTCSHSGDPHITSFDKGDTTDLRSGKFWMVRHQLLQIQGLFCGTYNRNGPVCNAGIPSTTRAIAIAGDLLMGHILIVEISEGRVYWDKTPIDNPGGAPFSFSFPLGGNMLRLNQVGGGQLTIDLPFETKIQVSRGLVWGGGNYMDVIITMRSLRGQDGTCGNFDGNPGNDKEQDYRVGPCHDLFVFGTADEEEIQVKVREETDFKERKPCAESRLQQALKDCAAQMPPGSTTKSIEECAFDVCSFDDTGMAANDAAEERFMEEAAAAIAS